jgi:hypothetical protein
LTLYDKDKAFLWKGTCPGVWEHVEGPYTATFDMVVTTFSPSFGTLFKTGYYRVDVDAIVTL